MERLLEILRQGIDQQMLFIRYDDLCSNPRQELERYYAYLGVPYYSGTTSATWIRSPWKTMRCMACLVITRSGARCSPSPARRLRCLAPTSAAGFARDTGGFMSGLNFRKLAHFAI